jgi:hypothetical protein
VKSRKQHGLGCGAARFRTLDKDRYLKVVASYLNLDLRWRTNPTRSGKKSVVFRDNLSASKKKGIAAN